MSAQVFRIPIPAESAEIRDQLITGAREQLAALPSASVAAQMGAWWCGRAVESYCRGLMFLDDQQHAERAIKSAEQEAKVALIGRELLARKAA